MGNDDADALRKSLIAHRMQAAAELASNEANVVPFQRQLKRVDLAEKFDWAVLILSEVRKIPVYPNETERLSHITDWQIIRYAKGPDYPAHERHHIIRVTITLPEKEPRQYDAYLGRDHIGSIMKRVRCVDDIAKLTFPTHRHEVLENADKFRSLLKYVVFDEHSREKLVTMFVWEERRQYIHHDFTTHILVNTKIVQPVEPDSIVFIGTAQDVDNLKEIFRKTRIDLSNEVLFTKRYKGEVMATCKWQTE